MNSSRSGFLGVSNLSWFFAIALLGAVGYFMWWGMAYTAYHHVAIFVIAALFGIFMAFNIGGNDVANSFGTSVGAGTLSITQALMVAAVFEVSGAIIAGGEVTDTIRKGIVDLSGVSLDPMQFVYIMMAALMAAAFWLLFATKKGWPVSTTHSIIGGIVGASLTLGIILPDVHATGLVQWGEIGSIAISWVLSPLLGGVMSYLLFGQIKKHILNFNEAAEHRLKDIKAQKKALKKKNKKAFERLSELQQIAYTSAMARDARAYRDEDYDTDDLESDYYRELARIEARKADVDAHRALEYWVPLLAAGGAMIISAMMLFKGLKHLELGLSTLSNYLIMGMIGAAVWMATFIYAKTLKTENLNRATFLVFSWMQVFTASGFAFSHGSNDIANAIGPFAAILDVLKTNNIATQAPVPLVTMAVFGVALIAGLWFIGKEVIQTVGTNLAKMHPSSGFAAELSAASVVMIASILGLPVSSTHILVGAVLGIGLVNRNANWMLMRPIALAWVVTLPAAGAIASVAFLLLSKFA